MLSRGGSNELYFSNSHIFWFVNIIVCFKVYKWTQTKLISVVIGDDWNLVNIQSRIPGFDEMVEATLGFFFFF